MLFVKCISLFSLILFANCMSLFNNEIEDVTTEVNTEVTTDLFDLVDQKSNINEVNAEIIKDQDDELLLWSDGVIHYELDINYTQDEIDLIREGMHIIERRSCVRFVELDHEHLVSDFLTIKKGDTCESFVGRVGGPQLLSLGHGCMIKINIVHELLHSIGKSWSV